MKLEKLNLVGAYLSCLPREFEPISGPIMETGFFALDETSLGWAVDAGVFEIHAQKADTILKSEYGLMASILRKSGKADTLMAQYREGIDWNDTTHHSCNGNRHGSRRGSLEEGISGNIYEHVFVKLSWCVRAKEATITSRWMMKLAAGQSGTEGFLDEEGYLRGISLAGTSGKNYELPPDVSDDGCYKGDLREVLEPIFSPI